MLESSISTPASNEVSCYRLTRCVAFVIGLCLMLFSGTSSYAGFNDSLSDRLFSSDRHSTFQQNDQFSNAVLSAESQQFNVGSGATLAVSNAVLQSLDSRRERGELTIISVAIRCLALDSLQLIATDLISLRSADNSPGTPGDMPGRKLMVAGAAPVVQQNERSQYVGLSQFPFSTSDQSLLSCDVAISLQRRPSTLVRHLIRGRATEIADAIRCFLMKSTQTKMTPVSLVDAGVFSFLSSVGITRRVYKALFSLAENRRNVASALCVPQAVCHVASAEFFLLSPHLKGEWI